MGWNVAERLLWGGDENCQSTMILFFSSLFFFFVFYSRTAHLNRGLTRRNNEHGISDSENGIQSEITYLNLPYFFLPISLSILAGDGGGLGGMRYSSFFYSFRSGFACEWKTKLESKYLSEKFQIHID